MRSRFIAVLSALALVVPAARAQDTRPGLAVMPFENGGSYGQDSENFEALTVGLQQMLTTEFAANPGLRVVERSRINDLISEQDLGASGRVDNSTAARIGQLVGARYMVFGSFVDFYGDMRIDIRVVSVETSEIVRTQQVRDRRSNLYNMVGELSQDLTRELNLPALPREVMQQRQSRPQPPENAVNLYTRAILYQDRGDRDRAIQYFQQAIAAFPEYTEAQQGLQQLQQS